MPQQIGSIARQHMKDPKEVVLTRQQRSPDSIDHRFVYCRHEHRGNVLVEAIRDLQPRQAIIFCRSRDEVERVCRGLKQTLDAVDYLHAGLGQDMRTIITGKFRSGRIRFLVATDVAARGLDFSGISHVFIYHLADDPDVYVHRSGRTGRQEKKGMVVTLVTDRELRALQNVLSAIGKEAHWVGEPPPPGAGSGRPSRRPPANRRRR
jgi:ATP-dependent RNA helicase DeaD